MPMTTMRCKMGARASDRARARWVAPAGVLLMFATAPKSAAAEIGVVSPCSIPINLPTGISVAATVPPHPQPITFAVSVRGVIHAWLESRTSSSGIDITLSGNSGGALQTSCGSININPVTPGSYQVSLYVVRDGQAPTLAQRMSVDIGAIGPQQPPPPPPAQTPNRDEFASTQPVGEIGFTHSVSLDGAAQISIPIFTPPGRQGVEPSLALIYSSHAGNGPLGVGWSLSGLSSVTSCRRSPALDEAYGGNWPDRLCLDGARLVEVGRSRLPVWRPENSYAVADEVQFEGEAYRANRHMTPTPAPPSRPLSGWTEFGPATATAEYRTETDSYRKVIGRWRTYDDLGGVLRPSGAYPDSLEVYAPDGSILKYAARPGSYASRVGGARVCVWGKPDFSPFGPVPHTFNDEHGGCREVERQRRVWMLDTVEDRFGNRMEIDYDPTDPLLPLEIRYTYHASATNTKAIRFRYEPRTDIRRASMDGLSYTAAQRLKAIDIVAPLGLSEPPSTAGVLRRYELRYDIHPITAQSILTQVTECAGDDPGAACLSPLRFTYSGSGPLAYADKPIPIFPSAGALFQPGFNGFRTADVNGDGLDDVLYRKPSLTGGWSYRLSDGVALGTERATGIAPFPDDAELGVTLVNFDRNQTVDALMPLGGANYAIGKGDPGGTFQVSGLASTIFTSGGSVSPSFSRVVAVADFNGDALPDLAVRHACRVVRPRTVQTNVGLYSACRWAVALNKTTSSGIDFTTAMDFRWSADPSCTEDHGAGYSNCAEAQPGDAGFVLDVDRNGESELVVPVRRGPTEEFFRLIDYSPELKALGFPIGTASALRGTGLSSRQMPRLFLDVNGDGLPDAVEIDGGQLSIAMNVGGTFDRPEPVPVSPEATAALSLPNELRVADFNDDGLEDIYLVSSNILLQANGQLGFAEKPLPITAGDDSCQGSACPVFARRKWDQLIDFNGDGLIDILQMRARSGRVLQRLGPKPGLLERVSGGVLLPEVRFSYKAAQGFQTPTGCAYPQYCLRKGMWLVSEVGVKANVSTQTYPAGFNRALYAYSGGRFDVRGRGWLGFAERVFTDEQTGATVTTTIDNATRQGRGGNFAIYRYPGAMRPVREVVRSDTRKDPSRSGKIHLDTTDYVYGDAFDVRVGNAWVATSVLLETRQTTHEAPVQGQTEGPFVAIASRRVTFDVDSFGLVTRETSEAFEGGFSADNTVPTAARVTRLEIRRTPSTPDQENWLVRRHDRVAATSTEPARAAVPASPTEPARPAVTARTVTRVTDLRWKPRTAAIERITDAPDRAEDPSLFRVTEFEYDPTGNVHAIRVIADAGSGTTERTMKIEWDTLDQTLIRRRENALKHAETFVYYAGLGELFSSDDANGLRTTTRRDRFGRPREINPASSAGSRISYELAPGGRLLVTTTLASGEVTLSYGDRWGQVVREERSRLRGNLAIVARTFNRLGQLATETLPHYDDEIPEQTAFGYDNLGRLIETSIGRSAPAPVVGQPLPASRDVTRDVATWTFDGLVTEHTNSRGVRSRTTSDGSGRIVRNATIEPQTGREIVTRLEYGPFDILDAVTDFAGVRTVYSHDIFGRRISTTDHTRGNTSTAYNGYGEIASLRDGDDSTSTIERDLLGRPEHERHLVGGIRLTSSYVWDKAPNAIGLLAEATSSDNVTTAFAYDSKGRLTKQEWRVPATTGTQMEQFATETVFDSFGRPEVINYPLVSNRQLALRFVYEAGGTFHKVVDNATGHALWILQKQDASGLALSERFGNATTTERFIDPLKRIKLIETTRTTASMPGAPATVTLQRVAYDYGAGGMARSRHNVSADQVLRTTEDFSYDFLGRLTHWRVYQNCQLSTQEYVFDDRGNTTDLRVLDGVGRTATLKYGPSPTSPNAGPFAVRELTEDGSTVEFKYDTAGRQTSGGRTITWSEFDLPRQIQSRTSDVRFLYDAAHNRTVKQVGASNRTLYGGKLYERRQTAAGTTHVFNLVGPAGVFAQLSWTPSGTGTPAEETWYFHSDSLGTPDVASSAGPGGALRTTRHEPFGQRREASEVAAPAALPGSSSVGFTGHEADDEVGLINMRGRIYDPATMRFLTPDPLAGSPLFSQSLNLYSYVYNNPTNFTDPTGFECADGADACIAQGPGGSGGGSGSSAPSGSLYSCPSWNPFACLGGNPSSTGTPSSTGGQQQPPTSEDATRRGADAGSGWGSSGSALQRGVDWFRGQMRPFALVNQGSWERLKGRLMPPLVPNLGSLTPPELRSAPPFPSDAPLAKQLSMIPTPFDGIGHSIRASLKGDFKAMGADQLDAFLFTFGPVVKDLALGDETTRLQMHMRMAVEDFNEIGYTPRQAAALLKHPHLAGAFRGHQVDRFFKIRFGQDDYMPNLRLTLPGRFGPDIYDPRGFRWWDVTTPGDWAPHVPRYGPSFGTGTPLLTR
jgi:RHS repeat-associated protein